MRCSQFSVDGVLVEELASSTSDHRHVTEYDGPPCPLQRGPCRHGGRCVPRLNDFDCQCTAAYTGRLCQSCTSCRTTASHFIYLFIYLLIYLFTNCYLFSY